MPEGAGGVLVGQLDDGGAEPLDLDDGDEGVGQDAAGDRAALEVFEVSPSPSGASAIVSQRWCSRHAAACPKVDAIGVFLQAS